MRQVGLLAAAGNYALDHHVQRLKEDNDKAKEIGAFLETLTYVKEIKPVQTNIVIFTIDEAHSGQKFLDHLKQNGVLATAFGKNMIRFVFHLDVPLDAIDDIKKALTTFT